MKISLKNLELELRETSRIESLIGKKIMTEADVSFLKERAEKGSPRGQFNYGFYLLLDLELKKEADVWFEKGLKNCNGFMLWRFSARFAMVADYLKDEHYIDWSMRCLRRSAWRQFPLAKRMLKAMKENPFHYPEA